MEKQEHSELYSQEPSKDSITRKETQSKKASGTKGARHKGQEVLYPTKDKRKQMNLELHLTKAQTE